MRKVLVTTTICFFKARFGLVFMFFVRLKLLVDFLVNATVLHHVIDVHQLLVMEAIGS